MNVRPDPQRLVDMIQHAQEAIETLGDTSFAIFSADRQLQLVIFYLMAVVGEAASKCDPETLRQYPGVIWHRVRATRNHLIHNYYNVDLVIVYRIVVEHLPTLIAELTNPRAHHQGGQPS